MEVFLSLAAGSGLALAFGLLQLKPSVKQLKGAPLITGDTPVGTYGYVQGLCKASEPHMFLGAGYLAKWSSVYELSDRMIISKDGKHLTSSFDSTYVFLSVSSVVPTLFRFKFITRGLDAKVPHVFIGGVDILDFTRYLVTEHITDVYEPVGQGVAGGAGTNVNVNVVTGKQKSPTGEQTKVIVGHKTTTEGIRDSQYYTIFGTVVPAVSESAKGLVPDFVVHNRTRDDTIAKAETIYQYWTYGWCIAGAIGVFGTIGSIANHR
jgi:hypothetical protein